MFINLILIFKRGKIFAHFAQQRANMLIYTIIVFAGIAVILAIFAMTVLNGDSHSEMTVLMLKLMCMKEQVVFDFYPEIRHSSGFIKTDLLV